MNENVFKYLAIIMGVVVIWSFCSRSEDRADSYNVEVQTVVSAAEGLNLKAVGELLKKANDAETFEKLLNSKDEGINNLDLNEDGKVDYIFVTEYGNEKVKISKVKLRRPLPLFLYEGSKAGIVRSGKR